MKNKIITLAICAMLFAFPAEAQQPTKLSQIGLLDGGSAA